MLEIGDATLELGGMYCLKNAMDMQVKEDGELGKKVALLPKRAENALILAPAFHMQAHNCRDLPLPKAAEAFKHL